MIYSTYPYGHDYGNTKTAGVTHVAGQQKSALIIPSALARGTYEDLQGKIAAGSSGNLAGILNQTSHTIRVRNKSWYVGELAIAQNTNTPMEELTSRGDLSRYFDDRNLGMLLSTSGSLIPDAEYGLAVVANLPVDTHNDTNAKRVKLALEGDHPFVLDGRNRMAHVRVMKTIQEGAGANIAHGPGGKAKVGVVDIGGRTTDAYLVTGQLPITDQCRSFDIGVETASKALMTGFVRTFDYPLTPADARAVMFAYAHDKNYHAISTVINAEAQDAAVDRLAEAVMREVGGKIAAAVRVLWGGSLLSTVVASDVDQILLVGGGAYYFEQDLAPVFGKRLILPPLPEYANATGFEKLAAYYLQREQMKAQVS